MGMSYRPLRLRNGHSVSTEEQQIEVLLCGTYKQKPTSNFPRNPVERPTQVLRFKIISPQKYKIKAATKQLKISRHLVLIKFLAKCLKWT